jgi:hypothetical protein
VPTKNPYFIDRGIARKGSNQARSVEVGKQASPYTPQRLIPFLPVSTTFGFAGTDVVGVMFSFE